MHVMQALHLIPAQVLARRPVHVFRTTNASEDKIHPDARMTRGTAVAGGWVLTMHVQEKVLHS